MRGTWTLARCVHRRVHSLPLSKALDSRSFNSISRALAFAGCDVDCAKAAIPDPIEDLVASDTKILGKFAWRTRACVKPRVPVHEPLKKCPQLLFSDSPIGRLTMVVSTRLTTPSNSDSCIPDLQKHQPAIPCILLSIPTCRCGSGVPSPDRAKNQQELSPIAREMVSALVNPCSAPAPRNVQG